MMYYEVQGIATFHSNRSELFHKPSGKPFFYRKLGKIQETNHIKSLRNTHRLDERSSLKHQQKGRERPQRLTFDGGSFSCSSKACIDAAAFRLISKCRNVKV